MCVQWSQSKAVDCLIHGTRCGVTTGEVLVNGLRQCRQRQVDNRTQANLCCGHLVRVVTCSDVRCARTSGSSFYSSGDTEDCVLDVVTTHQLINRLVVSDGREACRQTGDLFPRTDDRVQLLIRQLGQNSVSVEAPLTTDRVILDTDVTGNGLLEETNGTGDRTLQRVHRIDEVVADNIVDAFNVEHTVCVVTQL
ncbi:hypothetical protein D3C84_269170 [compost metagenome]